MKYKIIKGRDYDNNNTLVNGITPIWLRDGIVYLVNEALNEGWKLQGSAFMDMNANHIYQPMIKEEQGQMELPL